MTTFNTYCTLADYKAWATTRGQTASTDTNDDVVIAQIIDGVSRYFDSRTHRSFYPRIATKYFSVPENQNNNRVIFLNDDLLEVLTLTNGDTVAITSTEYNLKPKNFSPYYAIQLKDSSSVYWAPSGAGSVEDVVSILAWWGFHTEYARGWTQVGTLGAAVTDTTTLGFTATAGHTIAANQIVKIDTEVMNILTAGATAITVPLRGDNGSTAATHLINAPVYAWNVQAEIKMACMMAAQSIYQTRTGQTSGGKITVTQAGVVIRPEDIPASVQAILDNFVRTL
jgi:hypothetical protein